MPRDRPGAAAPPRSSVAISFGSPATESGVGRLDLNEILVRHPQAAFMMRIAGDSMREAGVCDGDLALVDRALTAAHPQPPWVCRVRTVPAPCVPGIHRRV